MPSYSLSARSLALSLPALPSAAFLPTVRWSASGLLHFSLSTLCSMTAAVN
ncbi:hypothetical protein [Allobaculum mucilyticum]|uniref:hypothetical protein n=1 Tax=Allobaculum mucilyticum TaxID=2834459 RepID=UPI001E4FB874|nr:hypothetical protein [Allobaculum mucilyticum]